MGLVNRALLSGEDGSGLRHKMVLQLFRFDDRALLAKTKALLMFIAIYTNLGYSSIIPWVTFGIWLRGQIPETGLLLAIKALGI